MAAVQHHPDIALAIHGPKLGSGIMAQPPSQLRDNALEQWGKIEPLLSGKQVILFLDYDGTLSPIVDQPEKAYMRDSMRPVLAQAAQHFTTAIVTGRSKEKVYDFVRLDGVFYAGSHGFEIQGPRSMPVNWKVASNIRPTLERSAATLQTRLQHVSGCEIEDNKFSMSVHYRKVAPERVAEVQAIVNDYAGSCPDVALKHGKKVLELRPNVAWNKGSAVLWILEALGLDKRDDIFPLYLGDDVTDEDAFKALQARCPTPPPPGDRSPSPLPPSPRSADRTVSGTGERDGSLSADAAAGGSGSSFCASGHSCEASGVASQLPGGSAPVASAAAAAACATGAMGGLGILVKEEHDSERPQETSAHFSLRNPAEVESFLQMLVARMSPQQQQKRRREEEEKEAEASAAAEEQLRQRQQEQQQEMGGEEDQQRRQERQGQGQPPEGLGAPAAAAAAAAAATAAAAVSAAASAAGSGSGGAIDSGSPRLAASG